MAIKPTIGKIEWATAESVGGGNVTEPVSRKTTGFQKIGGIPEKPTYEELNFMLKSLTDWVDYFELRTDETPKNHAEILIPFSTKSYTVSIDNEIGGIADIPTVFDSSFIIDNSFLANGKVFLYIAGNDFSAVNNVVKIKNTFGTTLFEHDFAGWGDGGGGAGSGEGSIAYIALNAASVTSLDLTVDPLLGVNTVSQSSTTEWLLTWNPSSAPPANANFICKIIVEK